MEVEAGGRRVPVRHTLERHIVSFLKRFLSDDLEGDVLCGVCAKRVVDSVRNEAPYSSVGRLQRSAESVCGGEKKKKTPGAIILLMTNLYAAEPAESQ